MTPSKSAHQDQKCANDFGLRWRLLGLRRSPSLGGRKDEVKDSDK